MTYENLGTTKKKIQQITTRKLPDGCIIGGFRILKASGAAIDKVVGDLNETTIEELRKLAILRATA